MGVESAAFTAGRGDGDAARTAPRAQLQRADHLPSGPQLRHRYRWLNRGGNRQANATPHRLAVVRLCWPEQAKAYAERRKADGLSNETILAASSGCRVGWIRAGRFRSELQPKRRAVPLDDRWEHHAKGCGR